ncbi:MAG: VWA domain-containing protein [Melioribacteraceae bacterium]|nr:VWA domain-containing protein [Melioribacteraceae bacterium]
MMKRITILVSLFLLNTILLWGNGVGIIDSENPTLLKLISSEVTVDIENQVAIITSQQTFLNDFGSAAKFKYAFPLPEGASAIELKWYKNGVWETAIISVEPQDTTLPGGSGGGTVAYNLTEYLGLTPLYFNFDDELLADSLITIELKYVQLLDYDFGNVFFEYPNNYQLLQNSSIEEQSFQFNLTSSRTIVDVQFLSHTNQTITNNGTNASITYQVNELAADRDYRVLYSLSTDEFGLFGFSTMLADSLVFDSEDGTGFFTFVAEPNPENGTDIIDKVFTLIIDKSGSMSGNKIVQARSAAEFIVNNLNEGDIFNIVDFSTSVFSFRKTHVANTIENRDAAISYIASINAEGWTNISDALTTSISQFSNNNSTANIIIFFTDGQATRGTTDTDGILNLVEAEIAENETDITLFTFGIGTGANRQLLTRLANENSGISEFLDDDEVEEVITEFYLKIKSPVLLDTEISFSSNNIKEIYPNPLPSLYKGQQMIVSGRYSAASETIITLKGNAFGKPVEYNYTLNLSDSSIARYQFLPKIWAKQKIEYLMVQFYSLAPNSIEADAIKEQILTLSLAYGIITEFTSFEDVVAGVEEEALLTEEELIVEDFTILGNYPNPFNPSTKISFSVGLEFYDVVTIKIYNSIGQLVRVLTLTVNGKGVYEVVWDGLMQNGDVASSDVYIYTVDFGNRILAGKMLLLK